MGNLSDTPREGDKNWELDERRQESLPRRALRREMIVVIFAVEPTRRKTLILA
jgi:hypothetical protein